MTGEKVRYWTGPYEDSSELFAAEQYRVKIVQMISFKLIGDGRQYSPLHSPHCSVLKKKLRVETKWEPWKDIFYLGER